MNRESKFNIISEGQRFGVSKTCKKHSISRTLYYRWLDRYKTKGMDGLDIVKKILYLPIKSPPKFLIAY